MKVIVTGASSTIGRTVSEELSQRHDVIRVGRIRGDYQVDVISQENVEVLFAQAGEVDAIISTTDDLHFGSLSTMTDRQFNPGLQGRLLGQIHLALIGQHFLCDGGLITLVSGVVTREPIAQGVNATIVNTDLEGFMHAVACELPRGTRINLISSTVLGESLAAYDDFFPGFTNVPATAVAQAYHCSIEGVQTGHTYPIGYQPMPAHRDRHLYQAVIAGTPTVDCLRSKN